MALPFLKLPAAQPPSVPDAPRSHLARGQAVGDSEDLRRILKLPRRQRPTDAQLLEVAEALKAAYGKGPVRCECQSRFKRRCCDNLFPVQAWALYEGATTGGILGPVGTGHGKSALDLLMPMVTGSKQAILLLPANLRLQMVETDYAFYGQHWHLPNLAGGRFFIPGRPLLHVISYSELSGSKSSDLLTRIKPDTIILDEAHNLRNKNAARTKRFLRYLDKSEVKARVFCWSGTLVSRSILDFAHLAAHSLKEQSPVPLKQPTQVEWASALDPGDFRSPPGKLAQLGGKDALEGFQKRLVESPGVVSSGDGASCKASLIITERKPPASKLIDAHLQNLEDTWQRPDGEELTDALSKARVARELSVGFYSYWAWPRGEPEAVIHRWLEVRKRWHKEIREKLKQSREYMDSPKLCLEAAVRWHSGYQFAEKDAEGRVIGRHDVPPHSKQGPRLTWASEHWPEWREVRKTAEPVTRSKFFDDTIALDTLDYLSTQGGRVAWYESVPFARRVLQLASDKGVVVTHAGSGAEGGDAVVAGLQGHEKVLASIRAHGEGKHFHMFSECLFTQPMSGGQAWEQALARLHRPNQLADEVVNHVYRHTQVFRDAVETARSLSNFIEESMSATQRLSSVATWGF